MVAEHSQTAHTKVKECTVFGHCDNAKVCLVRGWGGDQSKVRDMQRQSCPLKSGHWLRLFDGQSVTRPHLPAAICSVMPWCVAAWDWVLHKNPHRWNTECTQSQIKIQQSRATAAPDWLETQGMSATFKPDNPMFADLVHVYGLCGILPWPKQASRQESVTKIGSLSTCTRALIE